MEADTPTHRAASVAPSDSVCDTAALGWKGLSGRCSPDPEKGDDKEPRQNKLPKANLRLLVV
jgi:hypothetical protein